MNFSVISGNSQWILQFLDMIKRKYGEMTVPARRSASLPTSLTSRSRSLDTDSTSTLVGSQYAENESTMENSVLGSYTGRNPIVR